MEFAKSLFPIEWQEIPVNSHDDVYGTMVQSVQKLCATFHPDLATVSKLLIRLITNYRIATCCR